VPATSGQGAAFRVEFDLEMLAEDSDHSSPRGRAELLNDSEVLELRRKAADEPEQQRVRERQ
jgi:hypothetical protein